MANNRKRNNAADDKPSSGSLKFLYDRYVARDAEQRAVYEDALANADVARKIYDLRVQARLSQRALAQRVGTTASVICRLENADYDGHSLSMLRRIAAALHRRVEIRFVSVGNSTRKTRLRRAAAS